MATLTIFVDFPEYYCTNIPDYSYSDFMRLSFISVNVLIIWFCEKKKENAAIRKVDGIVLFFQCEFIVVSMRKIQMDITDRRSPWYRSQLRRQQQMKIVCLSFWWTKPLFLCVDFVLLYEKPMYYCNIGLSIFSYSLWCCIEFGVEQSVSSVNFRNNELFLKIRKKNSYFRVYISRIRYD